MSVRVLEDLLCDPAATDFLVDFVEKRICPSVGDQEQCHNLAEGLLPTLVQWIRASTSPATLCSSAGVCGADVLAQPHLNKPALRAPRDTAECALCRYVVVRVQDALKNSATMDKVKEVALQVCGSLPTELADSCADFVNTYEPMVAELVEDMDPDSVCALAGVCGATLAAHPPPPLPATLVSALLSAASPAARGGPMHLAPMLGGPAPGGPHGPGGCGGPPPVIGLLMALAHPPPVMMPVTITGPGAAVSNVAAANVGMMGAGPHGPGPHHGGPGGMMGGPGRGMMGMMGAMMGAANGPCEYCKMAVLEAHSLISNPSVRAEVLNYTLGVCDSFPTFTEPCKTYVGLYAPLVFTVLEQYLAQPDSLCAQAGMCPPPPTYGSDPALPEGGNGGVTDWLAGLLERLGMGGWAEGVREMSARWFGPEPAMPMPMRVGGGMHTMPVAKVGQVAMEERAQ